MSDLLNNERPMSKYFLRGMAAGIFIPVAIIFNSYLSRNLSCMVFFDAPDWFEYIRFVLLFPTIGFLSVRTMPPLTNYELVTLCTTIIATGFLYAIVFIFIKKWHACFGN